MKDAKALSKNLYFRSNCLKNFVVANMLLKKGALAGLNLYQIASIIYKKEESDSSLINKPFLTIHSFLFSIAIV